VTHGARVLEILAIMCSTSGEKRMEFLNRDFNAAIHIRRCAVLKTRSAELTRPNFLGQSLRLEVHGEKLQPIAGERSETAGRRL